MSSPFKLATRRDLGAEAWDALADESDEAWLWHRYDLPEALETWPGSADASFALMSEDGGDVLALVPLRRVTQWLGGLLPVHVLESLGGVALRNGLGERRRRALLAAVRDRLYGEMRRGICLDTRISLAPMAPALRGENCPRVNPLLDLGCRNALTQSWVVDLRGGREAVWRRMQGRARTAIRKAEKNGVIVREAGPDDLAVYYRLHCETYGRTGARAHPEAYFRAIWEWFRARNLARLWIAEIAGEPVAAENFGVYKQAANYWTGAASAKGLAAEASSLLQWTAMTWMLENGIAWYETGEAFPASDGGKEKGLNDFKKSFGGDLYPFYKGSLRTGSVWEKGYRCVKDLAK